MALNLTFLGGAGTVTGSRHLLSDGRRRVLVDCGLFQGLKQLRLLNWAPSPVPAASIDEVLLTHAHIDHSGYLPALVKQGSRGDVRCSPATADLCRLLLPDSGHLQEQDAAFANRHGFSKHHPALPLYGEADARRALERFSPLEVGRPHALGGGAEATFRRAGHILGACTIEIAWAGQRVVFSGDLGRYGDALMVDPEPVAEADYLLVESTYGNRRHGPQDVEAVLGEAIERTVSRGGTVVIPAFAVGRVQSLLLHLYRLKQGGRLGRVRVYVDSPMATNATELLHRHSGEHRLSAEECAGACGVAEYVRDVEASKQLTASPMPKVIISASGMATGGRVLHHLKAYAPDDRSTILFSGFQAAGTRGAAMVGGADAVKIHGRYVPVRAEVANLPTLSAHADADEILRWLRGFRRPPKMTFVVHGEPAASDALRLRIQDELGWAVRVPERLETVELS